MRLFEKGKIILYDSRYDEYYPKSFGLYKPVLIAIVALIAFFLLLVVKRLLGITAF